MTIAPVSAQNNTIQYDFTQRWENITIEYKPVQFALFTPFSTGGNKGIETRCHFSVNILIGVTGQIKGFEIGGMFNVNKYGSIGVQIAGIANLAMQNNVHFKSNNVQFSGLANYTECGKSVQFSGGFNIGDVTWFQVGGLCNIVSRRGGAQIAGIFNYGDVPLQVSGIANLSARAGVQIAGIANVAANVVFQNAAIINYAHFRAACQIAGLVNVARKKSECQIAGLVNVTKKGRFQMGLINVRDTVDGVSLGLINIVKHGGMLEAGIEAGEFVHTALTFRSGVPRLYSTLFLGYNYVDNFWAFGSGPGTSFKLKGNLGLNLELTYAVLFDKNSGLFDVIAFWRNSLLQFKPVFNYRIAKHFKIYTGPTFNMLVQVNDGGGWFVNPPIEVKIPYPMYNRTFRNSTLNMWIGVVGGVKF